jgi:hypothetical protein
MLFIHLFLRAIELKNWRVLADAGCAAQLYGRFNNGIVCGYVDGRTLELSDAKDLNIVKFVYCFIFHLLQIEILILCLLFSCHQSLLVFVF